MENIQFFFILLFILAQGALGAVLLYRAFAPVVEGVKMESLTNVLTAAAERLKAAIAIGDQYVGAIAGSFIGWRRGALLVALVIPGSIFLLFAIAIWRLVRKLELSLMWRLSTRRLKTALQNIAL